MYYLYKLEWTINGKSLVSDPHNKEAQHEGLISYCRVLYPFIKMDVKKLIKRSGREELLYHVFTATSPALAHTNVLGPNSLNYKWSGSKMVLMTHLYDKGLSCQNQGLSNDPNFQNYNYDFKFAYKGQPEVAFLNVRNDIHYPGDILKHNFSDLINKSLHKCTNFYKNHLKKHSLKIQEKSCYKKKANELVRSSSEVFAEPSSPSKIEVEELPSYSFSLEEKSKEYADKYLN